MKKKQLKAIIEAQSSIIGQLQHLLAETEKAGVFQGNEPLRTLKSATESIVTKAKAGAFDKITTEI